MKKLVYITIILLSALSIQAQMQKPSKQTVALNKEIFKIIKKNSLFTNQLNWKEIEAENNAIIYTDNDEKIEQLIFDFYKNKLRAVGDKHSFFISSQKINEISQTPVVEMPQGDYLGDSIGWVKVPRCLTIDENKDLEFANEIRAVIQKIDTENTITGWIVDLRHNGGGNVWPMLAGLNALIDDGNAGYFVSGKSKTNWPNINGYIHKKKVNINTYKIKNNKVKIAVLFDVKTGSSGEMTAISFLGLPNVKSFGQTTSGYTTANYSYNLSSGSQLYLAQTYVMDRTQKSYKTEITPDVAVDDLSNNRYDQVIQTAINGLKSKQYFVF